MNHKLNCNDKCLVYLLTCNVCLKHMFDKQSRNLGIDGTITKAMVVNIKSMTHVCRNIFLSIFMRRDTIVRWEMSLLHWFTKLTHQALYREKTIGEVLWRQWRHGDWTLKTLSKIAFCVILAPGFKRIVISTRFTQTILVPIIIISTFITIIAVAVIIGVGVGVGVCVCVCLCVCVYVHPPWRLHLSGTAGTAREQINDVVLKTLDSSAGSLHFYFGMQNITFQLVALSCSYTRSGHSHYLTSVRLVFRT